MTHLVLGFDMPAAVGTSLLVIAINSAAFTVLLIPVAAYSLARKPARPGSGSRRGSSAHRPFPYAVTCSPARSGKDLQAERAGCHARPAARSAPGELVVASLVDSVRDDLPR
jgi:hypothetical protein